MHAFKIYTASKNKKQFFSKYFPWCQEVFTEVEHLINLIDSKVDKTTLTDSEVDKFSEILAEMYSSSIEDEITGMIIACEKLMKLKVRIWKRLERKTK